MIFCPPRSSDQGAGGKSRFGSEDAGESELFESCECLIFPMKLKAEIESITYGFLFFFMLQILNPYLFICKIREVVIISGFISDM